MAFNDTSVTIPGEIYWAKVFGEPRDGYNEGEKQWSFELGLADPEVTQLTKLGLAPKIKGKSASIDGPFVSFKRRELKKKTGEPNKPIPVFEADGKTLWNDEQALGNRTKVLVKFNIYQVPAFGKKPPGLGVTPLSITVTKLVPYVRPNPTAAAASSVGQVQAGYKEEWRGDVV